jgi:hypothetical protein
MSIKPKGYEQKKQYATILIKKDIFVFKSLEKVI